jgi:predicted small secreted protein
MVALRRSAVLFAVVVASVALAGCATAAAGEPVATPSTAATPTAGASPTAGGTVSDEWAVLALEMEAASVEAWTVDWFDRICGSVVVAEGDRMCTDHATTGAMLASNAPERIASLRAAGVDAHDLIAPADEVYAAAEAYFGALCDREPTTDCIGPVDDLTSALPRYADAVRAYIQARG